ncbi:uncharacterized protein LOC131146213 [Malania oleifera]|uniref:uncharacterized protein LOC131146213 n=1 Tax=Malania oleifera TaxID=397392 RepID=UPI0025AE6611|nr:uncharacterized protein LOC131146213 [Malania oleifera]
MPRSSRHKSSKHSSRDARDCSDSEKDSGLKEKKAREETGARAGKDSGSGEKRKHDLDAKDLSGSRNGEFEEEHSGSKRRKDRGFDDDGVGDRWNGGEGDRVEKDGEKSARSKAAGDSRRSSSRRHDGSSERREETEETKKSGSKIKLERNSSRKDGDIEREKKGREGKSEKLSDGVTGADVIDRDVNRKHGSQVRVGEEERRVKKVQENTESKVQDGLQKPEPESELEKRTKRKRDSSTNGEKHGEDIHTSNDRQLSSRDDISKDGRHKDERYRDKFQEDLVKDNKHQDDKRRDEQSARERTSSRSDDKQYRDGKDTIEIRQKKSKPQDRDRGRDRERDREHERDRDRDRERDRDRDRDRERDRDRDRDRKHDRDRDRNYDRDLDHYRDSDGYYDHDRGRERDRDHISNNDDRSSGYRDKGKKRYPDDNDDRNDLKSKGVKVHHSDLEKRSLSSSKVDSDADKGRSRLHQAYADTNNSINRHYYEAHQSNDEYRYFKQENLKYGDYVSEQRTNASSVREFSASGAPDRVSRYRSLENPIKMDGNLLGELSIERSSSSKASPMGLTERSPSLTSIDRGYMSKAGVRRSLDVDETGRKSSGSNDARDSSANEDRLSRDIPLDKRLVDESSQADSLLHNRTGQNSSSSFPIPPQSAFRSGVDSPSLRGSLEDDVRGNSSIHYRTGDVRGHVNALKGVSNWSSPLPNGFIPFQHGPPHGGFQGMLPPFSSPLFGVRPALEINQSGIPYHIPHADRFSSHLRPIGWPHMVDSPGPSHLHGWDGHNDVFRGESRMYGGPEWDQNRNSMNGRGWETSADMWKGQNGDVNMESVSASQKDDYPVRPSADDELPGLVDQKSQSEINHHGVQVVSVGTKRSTGSPSKEISVSPPKSAHEKTPEPSKISTHGDSNFCLAYLSKLDISAELVRPELYKQCVSLLDLGQGANVVDDVTNHVKLEDTWTQGPKVLDGMLSAKLFPTVKDSVLQRAMDLYRKQMVEVKGVPISNGGRVNIFSASGQEKVEEHVPVSDEERSEEPVLSSDPELSKEPVYTSDQEKSNELILTSSQEIQKDPEDTSSHEVQEHVHTPSVASETPVEALSSENLEEPQIISSEKMDAETPDEDKPVVQDCSLSLENSSQTPTIPLREDEEVDELRGEGSKHSACFVEEQAIGDATDGCPLFCRDESSRACEGLMPGSNESESVILSRIHHSPENTH